MSYVTHAKEYEDKILAGMAASTEKNCYVPVYASANGLAFNSILCETIEASIMRSEKHVGKDIHLLPTAFADYLFERFHVPDVDCEFLTMMCHRLMARVAAKTGEDLGRKVIEDYGPYIDWDAYYRDHPDKGKEQPQ